MLAGTKWLIAAALTTPVVLAALSSAPVAADLGSADSSSPPASAPESSPESPAAPATTPPEPVPVPATSEPAAPDPLLTMESQLAALGLPTGTVDGTVTSGTRRGLCTFRDLMGLRTTRERPTPSLMTRIATATELPRLPRKLRDVKALVSLTCQATYVTDGRGTIVRVLPVSTGKDNGMHRTRPGIKRVYYKVNRWQRSTLFPEPDGRPGLYRPIYFDRGIAFHGVRKPIRTYPQSHACVRTWPSDQDWLWDRLQVRDKVFVYGDYWRGRSASLGGYGRPV
jgi:hypothetical protein